MQKPMNPEQQQGAAMQPGPMMSDAMPQQGMPGESPEDTTAFKEFVMGAVDKILAEPVMEALSKDAETNGADKAISRVASFAVSTAYEQSDDSVTEEMVLPAAIEIALYLHEMMVDAGRAEGGEGGVAKAVQATVAAVMADAGIDPREVEADISELLQGAGPEMGQVFQMLEGVNADAPQQQMPPQAAMGG